MRETTAFGTTRCHLAVIRRSKRRINAQLSAALVALALACLTIDAVAGSALPHYVVTGRIDGSDGSWDYAMVEPASHRLYLSHNGAATLDLEAREWESTIDTGAMVSGVIPLPALNRLIFTERSSQSLVAADLKTRRVVGHVATGQGSDGLAFDADTGLAVVAAGGASGFASLVDVVNLNYVAQVKIGAQLEFPVSNGHGTVYINLVSRGQIAVLDLRKHVVVGRYTMNGCKEPTGLAYDSDSGLLISSCDKLAVILRAKDGSPVISLPIGAGADAVFVDEGRRLGFIPCGETAELVIIDLSDPTHPRVAQVVRTEKGARTGAVDPRSGTVYLPTAKPGPVPAGGHWPSALPGTFHILVLEPHS